MDILPQLVANSIIAGALYAVITLGFNLIYTTTRFIDISYGAIAVVGGYGVFFLSKKLGLDLAISIPLAVIFAGALGFIVDRFVYSKLRARKASNMIILIASLGVFTVLQAIVAILFSSQFQTLSALAGETRTFEIWGGVITDIQLVMLISGLLIFLVLAFLLKKTMFGKALRAVSDDVEVAKIVGINTDKIIGKVVFLGSAIAGLAGIFIGFDTGIEPTMGMALLLKGVVASIIGGIGNIYGGIVGAFLLGFVENFGIWQISGEWKDAIAFGVLILFLLFRPNGILRR
ncbi:MAG: branched-chain amino acid ABC transporter permease [Patescibacteria group bacterium]